VAQEGINRVLGPRRVVELRPWLRWTLAAAAVPAWTVARTTIADGLRRVG